MGTITLNRSDNQVSVDMIHYNTLRDWYGYKYQVKDEIHDLINDTYLFSVVSPSGYEEVWTFHEKELGANGQRHSRSFETESRITETYNKIKDKVPANGVGCALLHRPNSDKDYLLYVLSSDVDCAWQLAWILDDLAFSSIDEECMDDLTKLVRTLRREGWTIKAKTLEETNYKDLRDSSMFANRASLNLEDFEYNAIINRLKATDANN